MPAIEDIENRLGLDLSTPPILVTFHPVTLELEDTKLHITNLLDTLASVSAPIVFTAPNADPSSNIIRQSLEKFIASHSNTVLFQNLGTYYYFGIMKEAQVMVGNSSSGIIEAASFELPVVNIGTRQKGRIHGKNIINTDYDSRSIFLALTRAMKIEFKRSLNGMGNPYGDGNAAQKIVDVIRETPIDSRLLMKSFADLSTPSNGKEIHE